MKGMKLKEFNTFMAFDIYFCHLKPYPKLNSMKSAFEKLYALILRPKIKCFNI